MQFLLMCRSLTYAQRTERVLGRAGITAGVIRAPRSISSRGCGYCVTVGAKHGPGAVRILEEAGMKPERVYRRLPDGTVEEAAL